MNPGMCWRTPAPVATRRLVVISLVVGVALGAAAAGGYWIAPSVEIFMSQFGLFVVVPTTAGFFASTRRAAAWAATSLLVIMCLVYPLPYAVSILSLLLAASVWTVFSLVAGPVFGLAGHALRTDDRRGVLAAAGVIGILAGEFVRMSQKGIAQGDLGLLSLTLVFDATAVAVVGFVLRPGRRAIVALYAVPMTVLGYLVTFVLR